MNEIILKFSLTIFFFQNLQIKEKGLNCSDCNFQAKFLQIVVISQDGQFVDISGTRECILGSKISELETSSLKRSTYE